MSDHTLRSEVAPISDLNGRPRPDDPRKPASPWLLSQADWLRTLKATLREFNADGLSDAAASLTYYAVLSIFPALIALVSVLGLIGLGGSAVVDLVNQLARRGVIPASATDGVTGVLAALSQTPAPGLGLAVGILAAVWSASNYVKGFARTANRIYEVPEGRGFLALNLHMLGLTFALLLLAVLAVVALVVSGPLADLIGDALGLGSGFAMLWASAKGPALLVAATLGLTLLFYFAPNVRQPRFRWVAVGALVALVLGGMASAGFGFYVANFGNYDATYGALAGVIVFLFWLWIINAVLLLGLELAAELERTRELAAGFRAERWIQLPVRALGAALKTDAAARAALEGDRRRRLQDAD